MGFLKAGPQACILDPFPKPSCLLWSDSPPVSASSIVFEDCLLLTLVPEERSACIWAIDWHSSAVLRDQAWLIPPGFPHTCWATNLGHVSFPQQGFAYRIQSALRQMTYRFNGHFFLMQLLSLLVTYPEVNEHSWTLLFMSEVTMEWNYPWSSSTKLVRWDIWLQSFTALTRASRGHPSGRWRLRARAMLLACLCFCFVLLNSISG